MACQNFFTASRPNLLVMEKGAIGKRILAELNRQGYGSRARLAEALDVSPQRLGNWINGLVEVPEDRIPEIADHFGLTVDQLSGKRRTNHPARSVKEVSSPYFPVGYPTVDLRLLPAVPCGNWESPTDTEDLVEVEAKFEHPKRFAAYISGDSCVPVLEQGDLAIFHEDLAPPYGTVVLARRDVDNATTVKKLSYDGRPRLMPVNPSYAIEDADNWRVMARLVGIVRTMADGTELSLYNPRGIRP